MKKNLICSFFFFLECFEVIAVTPVFVIIRRSWTYTAMWELGPHCASNTAQSALLVLPLSLHRDRQIDRELTIFTGVDSSNAALEYARQNAVLNSSSAASATWVKADVDEFLDERLSRGSSVFLFVCRSRWLSTFAVDGDSMFDLVIVDPPALMKGAQRTKKAALLKYLALNNKAVRLVAPGGTRGSERTLVK